MMRLDEREWKPVPIVDIFDRFEPGKGKGLNHLEQVEHGVSYIGATNRNNGVLCFIKDTNDSRKMMQEGNCIGFIKNGDGSAGYAIYKQELFVSTSDVIYGYASWLNPYTGLFFVAAQDMIENKYSHGYKRNAQHLKGDRVMLPVTDDGKPDYQFMEDYMRELMDAKRKQYRTYIEKQLKFLGLDIANRGGYSEELKSRQWQSFRIDGIFNILPGKRLVAADSTPGDRPFIGALDNSNGVARFVSDKNDSLDKNVLGVNYNGNGMGIGFYHPYECIFSDDVKRFHLKEWKDDPFILLFMKTAILMQKKKFGYLYKFNAERMAHTSIMLPVTGTGKPDYEFMESFGRKLMASKYNQYLMFLKAKCE